MIPVNTYRSPYTITKEDYKVYLALRRKKNGIIVASTHDPTYPRPIINPRDPNENKASSPFLWKTIQKAVHSPDYQLNEHAFDDSDPLYPNILGTVPTAMTDPNLDTNNHPAFKSVTWANNRDKHRR